MALALKQLTFHFDSARGATQHLKEKAVFDGSVKTAEAVLKGFGIKFSRDERKFYHEEIDLDIIRIEENAVTVKADFLIRDKSGDIDDFFEGWIQAVVIADINYS
jgi:hypothetical protein